MTQLQQHHPRGGWKKDEIDLLFSAVQEAARDGRPLRNVFADIGEQLQRKPNSIRNYYYARVKEIPELAQRQTPFRAFTQEELHQLLRDVLIGRGQGESVRACVTRLANGDRSAMLRYQNKYRSILKNKPEQLNAVADELRAEGLPCPENVVTYRHYGQAGRADAPDALAGLTHHLDDPTLGKLLSALCDLMNRLQTASAAMRERNEADESALAAKLRESQREADRLRVEVDLLKMALEDTVRG